MSDFPVLTTPDGRDYEPSSNTEIVQLVTAEGYKLPEGVALPDDAAFEEKRAKFHARTAPARVEGDDEADAAAVDELRANGDADKTDGEKSATAPRNKGGRAPGNKTKDTSAPAPTAGDVAPGDASTGPANGGE